MPQADPAPLRIGIVAAEPSGDLLASGLMQSLRARLPGVQFEGIAGPLMKQSGMDSWAPMESLSVMGIVEVLHHLPRLLRLRGSLLERWRESPPALFIGVDAPDFNLTLEQRLREQGIPTIHYVSPTVWAWRTGRVRKIRRAVDLLLVIFPFEVGFLAKHGIKARYVGHRLANRYPLDPDKVGARSRFGLADEARVLALLPGSRAGEVRRLAPIFLQAANSLRQELGDLQVLVPYVTDRTAELFEEAREKYSPHLQVMLAAGATQDALAACDVALVASGTATFEALLSKRPMVVGYRINPLTYHIVRILRLVRIKQVAMANLVSGDVLAPEFIQSDCVPDRLVPALSRFFGDEELRRRVGHRYVEVHRALKTDADAEAATGIIELMQARGLV